MRWLLLLAIAGCGDPGTTDPADADPADAVPAWTSGSIVRAQVFEGDGFRALAGRVAPELSCPMDEARAPAFANCPREVYLAWREAACTTRDIAVDPQHLAMPRYVQALAPTLRYFELGADYPGDAVVPAEGSSTCGIPVSGPTNRVAVEIDPGTLRVGVPVDRKQSGVAYVSEETEDGFAVVTALPGGKPVREGTGRVQARFLEKGGVRMYAGLYDAELEANCVAGETATGAIRCIPEHPVPAQTGAECGTYQLVTFTSVPAKTVVLGASAGRPAIQRELLCDEPRTLNLDMRTFGCKMTAAYVCRDAGGTFPSLTLVTE